MPPGVGYRGRKTGPTKKTRTVARIAANKGISRPAANQIRKKRKTRAETALTRGKSGKAKNPRALAAINKEKIKGSKRVKTAKPKMVKDTKAFKKSTKVRQKRHNAKTKAPTDSRNLRLPVEPQRSKQ